MLSFSQTKEGQTSTEEYETIARPRVNNIHLMTTQEISTEQSLRVLLYSINKINYNY